MKTRFLVSVALLVYCTVVCASHEEEQALTTSELRRELNRAMHAMVTSVFEMFTPGYTPSHPASSCKEILQLAPQSPSGLYWLRGTDNRLIHMYCDMERNCKGVAGGWMRVASIDMSNPSSTCPLDLKEYDYCGKAENSYGCSSVVFQIQGVQYSQVCGKIIGYQKSSTAAFQPYITRQRTIGQDYVDGISLTHGQSPLKHIWTFAAALHEHNSEPQSVCPCTNTRNNPPPPVPDFVGNDYFCDTGSEHHYQPRLYEEDPLWDGAGCGLYNTCCEFNSPPWFTKEISPPTSDDIEMRLCTNQGTSVKNIYFKTLELYVQ